MATPVADSKVALLPEELKEFARSLPTTTFPKNFFCTICQELAFDSWKLICCNKSICLSCQAKLEFPTTCPSCDHTPLEAESCVPNKAQRNTMRTWLQKQKKKEDAKAASKAATPPAEETPEVAGAQSAAEAADRPIESIESATRPEDFASNESTGVGEDGAEPAQRSGSTTSQPNEQSLAPQTDDAQRQGSPQSQNPSAEPSSVARDTSNVQNTMEGSTEGIAGTPGVMNANGMPGQFGFGFQSNQANFNAMGWNAMNSMNGMANMMPNGNWNNMNPMDFNMMNNMNGMSNMPNMSNGMFNGFGGNMGMAGMNDMSAMNMYGGGYGNWGQGANGAGYGNFNGYNQMGGYNQSGSQYPEMMNQYPKNNFSHQNRFHANGGAFPQNRNIKTGNVGGYGSHHNGAGSGFPHRVSSRPGSRNGAPQNRDGQTPDGTADASTETKIKVEPAHSSEAKEEGKGEGEEQESAVPPDAPADGADVTKAQDELTGTAGDEASSAPQTSGLNPIQTVDSIEMDQSAAYDGSMINNGMHPDQAYAQGMMNDYSNQMPHMNGSYDTNMAYGQNNFGPRGGFNTAYGAATVLVGEPRGLGVEGAPTGPRAMREGKPNTGYSSRANNQRSISNAPIANAPSTQVAAPGSPPRRGRASPERDETLRTKIRSPTRSRSRGKEGNAKVDRERSVDGDEKRSRAHSPAEEHSKNGHRHRSTRYDDRDDRDDRDARDADYDNRHRDHRDDREDREDRARSTSVDSKHRSRRDKEKQRSSRSHRDRSRSKEHRRRHHSRSRSHSPIAEDRREERDANATDAEFGVRRKTRSEKEKHRDRDSDRSRDKDRDRDRRDKRDREHERDHDYDREKDRSRDKDRERKRSRRDRDNAEEERSYDDEKYRSSHRSRKEKDRARSRDRDYENEPKSATSTRPVSPPINAPTGPSADGFSIRGFSKSKKEDRFAAKPMLPPPTGPRGFQPPKGPAADRDRARDHHRRKSSTTSVPTTPTTPIAQDHYAAEREKNARERDRLERDKTQHSVHVRTANSRSGSISTSKDLPTPTIATSSKSGSVKRSRDTIEHDDAPAVEAKVPTGPASHRSKRRKSDMNTDNVANLFAAGLRKHAGARERRRGGVKTEGSVERELERTEREREGGRR
ncbi:hypothetical protein K504DRAFT_496520 [Pleomassaria siparia CBS 279.74]|uniref:RING-type domain-containing protein n=1 Tax=Pleomassaria siparia CBS 279.74 TaxID=1314801 RepID=A0A6G1KP35_9PLEO|nr:hypothetical protein K504DRAFT_496520 [Pleomassaria siparia CBS 279.74]